MPQEIGLTIEEAAERLKLQPSTVRRWAKDGRIKAARLGRAYRITETTIDDLLTGRVKVNGEEHHGTGSEIQCASAGIDGRGGHTGEA